MKNFSKTLISMAAVMAVGSAMAVGAMAETLNFDQTNLTKDGTITITSGVTTGKSQYTLLVVKGTADSEGAYTYDANSSTIKQVDQNDLGTPFSSIVLGTKQADGTYKLDEGSYKVLVGNNDGSLDSGIFTVSNTPQVDYVEIKIGEVNGDARKLINAQDMACIGAYIANKTDTANIGNVGVPKTLKDGTTVKIGEVNGDARKLINAQDMACIGAYIANKTDTANIGNVGKPITVVK